MLANADCQVLVLGEVVAFGAGRFHSGIVPVWSRWRIAVSRALVSLPSATALSRTGVRLAMSFARNWASVTGGLCAAATCERLMPFFRSALSVSGVTPSAEA